jgi:hypothetical protein
MNNPVLREAIMTTAMTKRTKKRDAHNVTDHRRPYKSSLYSDAAGDGK